MSRRKRQPEQFDVLEFLRESDGDLKSALNSLLRSPVAHTDDDAAISGPGLKLVSAPAILGREGQDEILGTFLSADLTLGPGPGLTAEIPIKTDPDLNIVRGPVLTKIPTALPSLPSLSTPGAKLTPGLALPATKSSTPQTTLSSTTSVSD